jgi:hypothetical protein
MIRGRISGGALLSGLAVPQPAPPLELRARAEKTLARAEKTPGKKFNLRDFHDEVLRDGSMPLAVSEQIKRWIAQCKST